MAGAARRRRLVGALGVDHRLRAIHRLQLVRLRHPATVGFRQLVRGLCSPARSIVMLLPYFQWLESLSIGRAVVGSTWLFPVIESVHLLALSVLGGSILLVDLRMLGFGLKHYTVPALARD